MKRLFTTAWMILFFILMNSNCALAKTNCHKLQSILNKFRVGHKIPGMSLYVNWQGETPGSCYLFSGSKVRGENRLITPQNLWQIGSITKSYFSTILLQLEAKSEAGKIPVNFNINQKIKKWLPEYPDWGNVTIKQLLNMTGGIYDYTEIPNVTQLLLKQPKKIWTAREIIDLAYHHKPNIYFPPGKGWHYSNTDYILAGLIIQKIYEKTGSTPSFQEILSKNIFNKLRLINTYYYPKGLNKKLMSRMVHGYNFYSKKDFTKINLSFAGPAGGMVSNPKEVAEWIIALFDGKLLPEKQLQELKLLVSMKTGHSILAKKTANDPGYALGLTEQFNNKFGEIWLYQGLTAGYTAVYYYLPKYHFIISVAANVGDIQKSPIRYFNFNMKVLQMVSAANKSLRMGHTL